MDRQPDCRARSRGEPMSAIHTPPRLLRHAARTMLECAAYMADLSQLQLERIAESTDDPDAADIEAADALNVAIEAIDSARHILTE